MARYHLIGIGGTGLSAIARVLFERGETVTGSDLLLSPDAKELIDLGIPISIGHKRSHIEGADCVIRSSAIPDDNPEVLASLENNIPVLKRRDFLSELTKDQRVIAVAGTHGKTTTTSMATWCLTRSGLDPSYVIGSTPKNLGKNAAYGKGEYFVIEADEYDNMFLGLSPDILVITNIEHDHPDCFPSKEKYYAAFQNLTSRIKPGGTMIACLDNPGVRWLIAHIDPAINLITYGLSKEADIVLSEFDHHEGAGIAFTILSQYKDLILPPASPLGLSLPGVHNALNAAAVYILCAICQVNLRTTEKALSSFAGSSRRFEMIGQAGGIKFIDDYGHHPTEIKATLAAARNKYPQQDIWAVWQPHTYSRTKELFDAFTTSFSDCDHVIVTEIYRSRENEQDYSSERLVKHMSHPDKYFVSNLQEAKDILKRKLKPLDVLIVFSAGDANQITNNLFVYFQELEAEND